MLIQDKTMRFVTVKDTELAAEVFANCKPQSLAQSLKITEKEAAQLIKICIKSIDVSNGVTA